MLDYCETDEHFAFALSMYHDANREKNVRFRIARYFACLLALKEQTELESAEKKGIDSTRLFQLPSSEPPLLKLLQLLTGVLQTMLPVL